jgi:hypothetical protein
VVLQTEIWKFRTRTGHYAEPPLFVSRAVESNQQELLLEEKIHQLDDELLRSDALSMTDFRKWYV